MVPVIALAKEAVKFGWGRKTAIPTISCTSFENNKGAVEMATHEDKYHFFRQFIAQKIFHVKHLAGTQQPADILTKALDHAIFVRHRLVTNGW
jgi:hypothetical protein